MSAPSPHVAPLAVAAEPARGALLRSPRLWGWTALIGLGLVAPYVVYPVFAMNVLCLALFASAFNLLLGYVDLLIPSREAATSLSPPASRIALRIICSSVCWRSRPPPPGSRSPSRAGAAACP